MRLSDAFHISAQDRVHPGLIPSPLGTEPLDHFPVEIGRDTYLRLPRPQDHCPLQPGRIRLKAVPRRPTAGTEAVRLKLLQCYREACWET